MTPAPVRTAADLMREYDYQPLTLPMLPELENSARSAQKSEESPSAAQVRPSPSRTSAAPKPDFSGPQQILVDFPDPTNSVEIVRRLDLVAPPDLSYPVRMPSLVMLPPRATPLPAIQKNDPALLAQAEQIDIPVAESSTENPLLPVSAPKLVPTAALAPAIPKRVASDRSAALFSAVTAPDISETKAAVVINAVNLPAEPLPVIPDAQLSGKFAVVPSTDTRVLESTAEYVEVDAALPAARSGSSPGSGTPASSGSGTGGAEGKVGLPGISISGGTPGRSLPRVVATPRGSYAITIISGGGTGGASRDLGVFARNETVYTVYIPMAGIADGAAWPLEYALMGTPPPGNSLLTPPVVLKKVPAIGTDAEAAKNSERVFVTGIITETGKLEALRAIGGAAAAAQTAVDAFAQWEFEPAELQGKPVASKILIGVTISPKSQVSGKTIR